MANRTPGIVLSNLAVLALAAVEATEADTFFVALPAREGEFYFAVYVSDDVHGVRLLGKEQVASPDQLLLPEGLNEVVLLGEVWSSEENLRLRAEACTERVSHFNSSVNLEVMAQLAERRLSAGLVGDASSLKPNYVKEQLEY